MDSHPWHEPVIPLNGKHLTLADIYTHRRRRCTNCHSHCTIENHERSVFPCGLILDSNNHIIRECRSKAA